MDKIADTLPTVEHADAPWSPPLSDEESLDALRAILLDQTRQRLGSLHQEVAELQALLNLLEEQINDKEALLATITPVLADAVNTSIRESRDEMIEALYPITGRLVTKAISEAMRDLMRNIDHQMRDAVSLATLKRWVQARASGVSDAEMALRTALPFAVEEVFLIHRESGLLLHHQSRDPDLVSDSDLISGMLTAIRDFAQDAFGRGEEGQLEEVQYGDLRILLEAGKYSYIAVVVQGYEPLGYHTRIRERLLALEHRYFRVLRTYEGDASVLDGIDAELAPLIFFDRATTMLVNPEAIVTHLPRRTSAERGWSPHAVIFLVLSLIALALFGWRLWSMLDDTILTQGVLIWPL